MSLKVRSWMLSFLPTTPSFANALPIATVWIEQAGGVDTIIVFNRAIMLFHSRDEFFTRFHRVVCLIDRIERPNKGMNPPVHAPERGRR